MNVGGGSVKKADDAGRRHRWRSRGKRKDGVEVVGICWKLPEVTG